MMRSQLRPTAPGRGRRASGALRLLALAALLLPAPLALTMPAYAQEVPGDQAPANVADLETALNISGLVKVIAREGHDYGDSLDQSMFGGKGGPRWKATVSRIYEPGRLQEHFSRELAESLRDQPQVLADALRFFTSPTGKRIVEGEITGRETLLDPDAREAAEVAAEKLRDARSPRLKLIRALIEAGDLIENNVASGMTGSAAFNEALTATQPPEQRLPEEDRMAQVWRQEGEIRASTTNWLLTFMVLAYEPLSDQDLQSFVDFSKSDSGRVLNRAMFNAWSETFRSVMAELGHEAGQVLLGSRI